MEMHFLENKKTLSLLLHSTILKCGLLKSEMSSHTLRMRSFNADADFSSHPLNFDFFFVSSQKCNWISGLSTMLTGYQPSC